MYIYSVNSRRKIVHTGDCFYGKQIKPANRKQVDTIEAVVLGGFCLCRYCNPVVRQFREEQAQVSALCQEGEMTCRPVRRGILVQTPCSEWLIVPSEQVGGSELYHKNAGSGKSKGEPGRPRSSSILDFTASECSVRRYVVICNTSASMMAIGRKTP